MTHFVIDANVLAVANEVHDEASAECIDACLAKLEEIQASGIVVIDEADPSIGDSRILNEWGRVCASSPYGVGGRFYSLLRQHEWDTKRCQRVPISPRANGGQDFVEFPSDTALIDFDSDDRKYVAVALASGFNPSILNAVDDDWADPTHHAALVRNGVRIEFLCPDSVSAPST